MTDRQTHPQTDNAISTEYKLKPQYLILDFYVDIENKSDYNASGGITIVGADCIKPTTKVDERNEF